MSLSSSLRAVFCFRTFPTTFLIVLIYLTTFLSLYFADQLASVPGIAKQHAYGLSLDEAYRDLHLVSAIFVCRMTAVASALFVSLFLVL